MTVDLKRGINLKAGDAGIFKDGTSDPFVRIVGGPEVAVSKIINNTLNPEWNETFTFRLRLQNILQTPLRFEVFVSATPARPRRQRVPKTMLDARLPTSGLHTAIRMPL